VAFYIDRCYASMAEKLPLELGGGIAEQRAKSLIEDVGRQRQLRELATRPLLLTMITLLHVAKGGRLPPGGLAALYDETVTLLVDRWNRVKDETPLTDVLAISLDHLREALEKVAYDVHRDQADPTSESAASIPGTTLSNAFEAVRRKHMGTSTEVTGKRVEPLEIRLSLQNRAGILVCDSHKDDLYRFPHRSFQEYMAACALKKYPFALGIPPEFGPPSREDRGWEFPENLARLVHHDPDRWREVVRMAAGMVAKDGGDSSTWDLVARLLQEDLPQDRGSRRWWSALLAGGGVVEHRVLTHVQWHEQTRDNLRLWLRRTLELGALPPTDRAEAGRILALLGDDRPGVSVRDGVPDIDWVEIPAGEFLMGSDKEKDRQANAIGDETPQHPEHVDAFRIGKFPITVAQYRAFIEADGYAHRAYWTDDGWKRKEHEKWIDSRYWEDSTFNSVSQPVVGVSWFEADAYCRWLTERLHAAALLGEKDEVRLPTESEWEKAARGTGGRIYQWGDEFDAQRCNVAATGIGRPSAVGMFPLDDDDPWGDLPSGGPLDMSGNVWEWCGTKWRQKYGPREDNDRNGDSPRVLRGGAFDDDPYSARCACRRGSSPDDRWDPPRFPRGGVCPRSTLIICALDHLDSEGVWGAPPRRN